MISIVSALVFIENGLFYETKIYPHRLFCNLLRYFFVVFSISRPILNNRQKGLTIGVSQLIGCSKNSAPCVTLSSNKVIVIPDNY